MINIGFIMGHLILPNAHELGQNFSVHYFPPPLYSSESSFVLSECAYWKSFQKLFSGSKIGILCGVLRGILENIPRYTKETNNKQTLVINVTDERAKDPDNRYTIYNGKDF